MCEHITIHSQVPIEKCSREAVNYQWKESRDYVRNKFGVM